MNWNLSNDALTFIAVSLIAFGLVKCFYGYRIFKFILAVSGFIFGASAAGTAAALASPDNPEIAALLAGLIGGAVMAVLFLVLYFVVIFFFGAFLATSATVAFLTAGDGMDPNAAIVVSIISGLIGGILALVFQKFLIIVSTAFGGALMAAIGVSHFFIAHLHIGGPEDIEYLIRSLLSGNLFFLLGKTALGLTGTVFQYLNTARKAPATDGDSENNSEGGTDSETAPAPAQSPPPAPARSPDTATPRATPAKPAKPAPTDNYFVDGD